MTALRTLVVGLLVVASLTGVAVTTAAAADGSPPATVDETATDDHSRFDLSPTDYERPAPPRDTDGPTELVDVDAVQDVLAESTSVTDVVTVVPLIAGYSRFDDPEPMGHETREAIYDTVTADPGIYLAELARQTDTPVSTVRYHTRVLVRENLLERREGKGRTRLVPTEMAENDVVTVEEGTPENLLLALDALGRATGSELAAELDLTKSTVSYHLGRLAEDGLIERETAGRTVENSLTDRGDALVPVTADP